MEMRQRHGNGAEVQPGAYVVRRNMPQQGRWLVQHISLSSGQASLTNDHGGAITTSTALLEVKRPAAPGFVPRGDGLAGRSAPAASTAARPAPARPRKTNAEVSHEVERVMVARNSYEVLSVTPEDIELNDEWDPLMRERRKELRLLVHPDRGGTDEAMQKVHAACEELFMEIHDRDVTIAYETSRRGRVSFLKSRPLEVGDVVYYLKTKSGDYPKAVVCKVNINGDIFDVIVDWYPDRPQLCRKVRHQDLSPTQRQQTVSPSPSPSPEASDDEAAPASPSLEPSDDDDDDAPTSPERQLAKRPAEDRLVPRPKRPKRVFRSLLWQWKQNRKQSTIFGDLLDRFLETVAAASDATRDDLKDEKRLLSVAHAACPKRWTSERLKIIDERLERIHSDRGIDVLLLCGGMGACVVAIYNVGIKINSVTNWEIDPEARWVLENFCKKQGITIETGQPISAPPAVERPPSRNLAVAGNVDFAIAEDLAGKKYDVASATCSCVHFSLVNANRGSFNAKGAKQYFSAAAMLSYAEKENEDLNYLVENVIMDEDDTEKYNKLFRVPHVRTTDGTGPNSRPRSIRSTMRPVQEKPRCFDTFQELLDKLYGEGKYFALVSKIDCLKASARPPGAVKRCRATGDEEELAIEEALLLMGFPVDWFEGCDLEEDAMWHLLGNSCNVSDLEVFYKSLLRVHGARHGRDVAKEREDAIRAFRAARGF